MVKDKQFYKMLLMIALPAAFQSLMSFGVNMLDTIMVGSLGDVTLSATALANHVSTFLMMFIRGVSGGTAVLIAQYWGKKDIGRIKTVFGIGFKTSLVFTVIATLLILFFPAHAMRFFNKDAEVIAQGVQYLQIVAFSYILFAVSDTCVAMLRCVEVVKLTLYTAVLSFVTNAGANYVLIFGKLGFPAMGIRGAALATVFSRLVEFTVIVVYVLRFEQRLRLRVRDLLRNEWLLWKDFFHYGFPIVVGDVLWGFVGVLKMAILGRLGREVISANSIADVVLQLATLLVFGLANGACVVIGKSVGEGDYKKTREYSNTLQILFFAFGLFAAAVTFLLRKPVIGLYNVSDLARTYANQFLIVGSLTIWGTSYAASCFVGINRGSGDGRFVIKTDMIFGWLVVLPLTALMGLVFHAPPVFVYSSTRIDQIMKVFVAFFRLRGDKWIKNVTRA